jgi:hypothetical protein
MKDSINDLKALVKTRKAGDMPRLFVFAVLTGQLLYESNENPHKLEWSEITDAGRALFEAAAKVLRSQLSLCCKCGKQAPLHDNDSELLCSECVCMPFDQEKALARYAELYASLPEEYSEKWVVIQDQLDALLEEVNQHGLEFRIMEGGLTLVSLPEPYSNMKEPPADECHEGIEAHLRDVREAEERQAYDGS